MNQTPAQLGFHMPAEWEPHQAIWLSWPYDKIDFPDGVAAVEKTYVSMIRAIHNSEQVELVVLNKGMQSRVADIFVAEGVNFSKITFHIADYVSFWMRDTAPLFVVNRAKKQIAITKWIFNAWGKKYLEFLEDDNIGYQINQWLNLKMFEPGIVMEGGSLEVNGQGTLITSESCLLNKNRNPQLSKEQIEHYLKDYLGVRHFVWLKDGIVGDDTDGHIDDFARFVSPDTVICAYEEDSKDENYQILKQNFELLQQATDQDGKPLKVVKIPMPGLVRDTSGRRLPASYANFYIGNKVILVPTFGHPNDAKALQIMQSLLPGRKAIGIDARDLVFALGTFHCASQQQPSV